MPSAPPYNRQYSFTNYQTVNPATPLPAAQLDIELSQIKVTLDAMLQNVALIQRSDGSLANQSVGQPQLASSLTFGFTFRGPWQAGGTIYLPDDGVSYQSVLYTANVGNTSGSTPPSADPTNWAVAADLTQTAAATAACAASAADADNSALSAAGYVATVAASATAAAGSATASATSATASASSATASAASAATALTASVSANRSYLAGLLLSTAGASSTFGVSAGIAVSIDQTTLLTLASAYTKTTGAWTVGSGNGALDTGAIAASTWYHVYLIENTTGPVVDVLVSLSASAPTMPSGYTQKRRIGSMKTDASSHWTAFVQFGDEFLWVTPFGDVSVSNLGTTATLYALSVPPGVQVTARLRGNFANASTVSLLVNSPDEAISVANAPVGNENAQGNANGYVCDVRTNTAQQVRAVSTLASTTFRIVTYGYIDQRGRLA